jgi:hypothetical protein
MLCLQLSLHNVAGFLNFPLVAQLRQFQTPELSVTTVIYALSPEICRSQLLRDGGQQLDRRECRGKRRVG